MSLTGGNNTRVSSLYPSVSGGSKSSAPQLVIGRVISVELNDPGKLGQINYEALTGGVTATATAMPLTSNYRHIPVIDEIVAIIVGPSLKLNDLSTATEAYYLPPFGVWYNSHINKFPNLAKINAVQASRTPSKEEINSGIPISNVSNVVEKTSADDIEEADTSNTLRSYPGDIIIEGRWGHAIRFGSSGKPGINPWSQPGVEKSPITVITNGYRNTGPESWSFAEEDIDLDDTSIWMTSTQELAVKDIQENFSIDSFKSKVSYDKTTITAIPTLPTSYTVTSPAKQDRQNNAG